MPRTNPRMKSRVIRSWKIQCAASVTITGARLQSNVEFATEVSLRDQCQSVRSPAKNRPEAASNRYGGAEVARLTPSQSSGNAMATRQKAVALGPVSLNRTQIGAKP